MPRPGNSYDLYQNALLNSLYQDQLGEAQRQKTANRVGSLAQLIVDQYLSTTPAFAAGPISSGGMAGAALETGAANAGVAIAPTVSTAASTGIGGGAALASEGSAAASGASSASSGLASTGIGAAIAAGLMTGSATPGSWLFPLKRLGYGALHGVYTGTGGTLGERLFTGGPKGWGPEAMVNHIFGDPYEQERQWAERSRKAALARGMGYMGNLSEQLKTQSPTGGRLFGGKTQIPVSPEDPDLLDRLKDTEDEEA